MAGEVVLLDTSVLIDYYRKKDKQRTHWLALVRAGHHFAISAVTKYEIYSGATTGQMAFWDEILEPIPVIALDEVAIDTAVEINRELKRKRKQIHLADLFIASTAMAAGLPLATLNKRHFERIAKLRLVEMDTDLG
ncbi:MAG: type II toxin-antitoxin system VapC family toxin [Flavobacteriales bacterium]|nr:type II toxin-antitoxin system VapC family toxin [Flavobacteriales bacterium]